VAASPELPRGSVGPTRWRVLAVVFVVGGLLGYGVVAIAVWAGGIAPRLQWSSVIGLLAIGLLVGWLAYTTYRTVHRERGRIEPHRAVNLLLLAKASALAGALMAGGYVGFALPFVSQLDVVLPRERVIRAGCGALCGVALVVAGMLLEYACRVPKVPGDGEEEGGSG
jgi:Protein of unknown function (DUF3180)